METYVLQTAKVCKSFGKTEILHDVDLNLKRGEVYGLVGQNGAGKTTLMRLISGLMKPTKGAVTLNTDKNISVICRKAADLTTTAVSRKQ